jgi:signal transduction histidine kinase
MGVRTAMSERLEADRLRRLVELGPSLVSELDLEKALQRLVETARRVTGARYGALAVFDSEHQVLERLITRGAWGEQDWAIGAPPHGRALLGRLATARRPIRIADLSADERSCGFPPGNPPMSAFVGAPILVRGVPCGTICIAKHPSGEFDRGDEQWVVALAAWAAIAIERERLLAAAGSRQEALERAVRGLSATQAIAVAVGAETDLTLVLDLVAQRGLAMIDARSILILLREGDDLMLAAGAGKGHPKIGARIPISASRAGHAMVIQRPTRIVDVSLELRVLPQMLGVQPARAALVVPLVYRGSALGVLVAFDRDHQTYSFRDQDEQVLAAFAASAATAVATAQSVQADRLRHTIEAAEAERRHWARELHDETLQSLGGLKMLASSARREPDPDRVSALLDQLVSGLELEIENVHAIVGELRPAALDDLGLRPAIETLAERQRVVYGLVVDCELELPDPLRSDRRLAPELETTLYRLVQEGLSNVARHADATRVRIGVAVNGSHVRLEIADDGRGFDVSAGTAGFGLIGMRERVALAGGTIEFVSCPGGTTVGATLPAREAVSPPARGTVSPLAQEDSTPVFAEDDSTPVFAEDDSTPVLAEDDPAALLAHHRGWSRSILGAR